MLTAIQREEIGKEVEVADQRLESCNREIAQHQAAIDAINAEKGRILERKKIFTEQLKSPVDSYDRAHKDD